MKNEYVQSSWSLDELFAALDAPEVQEAVAKLETEVAAFAKKRPLLQPDISPALFQELIDSYTEIMRQTYRIGAFGRLEFAANTQNQKAQSYMAKMNQLLTSLNNKLIFFTIWWKQLDDTNGERLMTSVPDCRYWLEALRLYRPYTLSESEETIINLKNVNGNQALVTLYSSITNRYKYKMEIDGKTEELTRGGLLKYIKGSDPDLRAAAYQELNRVFGEDEPILGQIYQYRIRDWRSENMDLRSYKSPMAVRNQYNEIDDEIVNLLIDVSRDNVGLFQRYFKVKAKWIGVDKLRRYDLYAPLAESSKTYSYHDAVDLVIKSFKDFDDQMGDMAQQVFDEKHMDSEVRVGKRSGAFCYPIEPSLTPWVFQSYHGQPNDVATMAHELGHAVHYMLGKQNHLLVYHASLTLAETASTFAEMLLVDRILAEDTDESVRRELLFSQMDDAYATIMRQIYFAIFERDAHELINKGGSVDDLTALYLENLKEQFGDSMELSEDFKYEWVSIPHIYHTPFYVYAYAFGQLLVLALYKQYQAEGESFKSRYIELLAAGGTDAPVRILERAGIDVRTREFWQGGFDVIAEMLEEIEKLSD